MKRVHMLKRLRWALAIAVVLVAASATAAAAAPAPVLQVAMSSPDYVTAGRGMIVTVSVLNTGDAAFSGNLAVRYTLPVGVSIASTSEFRGGVADPTCQQTGQVEECDSDVTGVPAGGQIRILGFATVAPSATGTLVGQVEVSGGGALNDVVVPWAMVVGPLNAFAIKAFDIGMTAGTRTASVQAGAAPGELATHLSFLSEAADNLDFPIPTFFVTASPESFRDVVVHVPPGFVGNPLATPVRCQASQLTNPIPSSPEIPQCPLESQVGWVQLLGGDMVPLFNMQPPTGSPAQFGFFYQSIVITLTAKLRPSDNGIDIITHQAPSSIPIPQFLVTMWGVPGDPSHNPLRGGACLFGGLGRQDGTDCSLTTDRIPFLRTPTSCTGNPLMWNVDVDTYQHPEVNVPGSTSTPRVEGCQFVPFDPSFSITPTVTTAHAPTGLDTTLTNPQNNSPDGLSEADLRTADVQLPDGMTINPSAADGLQACTDDQLNLARDGVASCPDASKIGTVTLNTPLLDHPLDGSVFVRTQASDDPASGQMFRIAIEIRSDNDGIDIKLPGSIVVDPLNGGRMTAVFDDLPQLPFSSMLLHFKEGPRAPLVTPSTCGDNTATVALTPWSVDNAVNPPASFATTGCTAPAFAPSFRAGTENPVAGASTPFHVSLDRSDNDEQFQSLTVNTPNGLLGRIRSVVQCAEGDANAGTCPSGTLIGSAAVGAGVGSDPFFITNGQVFLTGPYKGAPFGLSVVVHALAGPFDLGTVVVRAAIHVDPRTAALSVTSDPFPTMLKGVPINLRTVRISIDRPGFMVNPTSCSAMQVGGTVTSTQGASSSVASRFQVGNCGSLKFTPKLSLSVGTPGRTSSGQSTPLSTTLTQPAGQSNLREVKVTLPTTLDALLPVVSRACTQAQFQAGSCKRAEVGSASAVTPLLRDPLRGGVFFVKHPGQALPDLIVALRGAVSLDLVGKITIVQSKYLTTDFSPPDAPVTRFTLRLTAGQNGPIGIVTNLCTKKARASTVGILMRGQNGASISVKQRMHIGGCGRTARASKRR